MGVSTSRRLLESFLDELRAEARSDLQLVSIVHVFSGCSESIQEHPEVPYSAGMRSCTVALQ